MKLIKLISAIMPYLICSACSRPSNEDLFGKYVNTYEKDAEHYVILKSDSSFFHYYKKNGMDAYINEGTYQIKHGFCLWIHGWDELGTCVYYDIERHNGGKNIMMEITYNSFKKELEFDYVYVDASSKEVNFKKVED